jgi:hypothetical protein
VSREATPAAAPRLLPFHFLAAFNFSSRRRHVKPPAIAIASLFDVTVYSFLMCLVPLLVLLAAPVKLLGESAG